MIWSSWRFGAFVLITELLHWNRNVAILMKFPSLASLEIVKVTISVAASDENFMKMTIFTFQFSYVAGGLPVDEPSDHQRNPITMSMFTPLGISDSYALNYIICILLGIILLLPLLLEICMSSLKLTNPRGTLVRAWENILFMGLGLGTWGPDGPVWYHIQPRPGDKEIYALTHWALGDLNVILEM